MVFCRNVGLDWWGKAGDSGRKLLLKALPHNSSHFVFTANKEKEREQKGEAE